MIRASLLVIVLTLMGCGEKIKDPPKAGDVIVIPSIEWHVVDQKTLEAVYVNSDMIFVKGDKLSGFAGVREDGTAVIFTVPPERVDDSITCTVGHEVMHVSLGKYHR